MENIVKINEIRKNAYHETKNHTDTMFAFNIYPCTIPLDFSFVPLHWQDSAEIIYIKRGSGRVQVDFETFHAKAGDIFIVMPGHIHGLRKMNKERMEYENIIFEMDFLGSSHVDICSQKYLQPLLGGKYAFPVYIGGENPLYSQIAACLDGADRLCHDRGPGYEMGVKGQMLVLFSLLFQLSSAEEQFQTESVVKIKNVLTYIEENYDQKLTVEGMAGECGYSASHFMRWFKEATGSGFCSYLIEYRLSCAARELRESESTIGEIASRTGFDNLSNFNRLFKKRFGMTPGQFRRENF